jgi:DNA-directed RNA polymerase subunit RPC12/RpoP
VPTEQATRFTCPECGATLDIKGAAAVAACSYCGKSARLQRRTKVMQRPVKLPPPKPDEPAPVARAHREWSVSSVFANVVVVAVMPIAIIGIIVVSIYADWHNSHSLLWDENGPPRLRDVDGDGIDDVVGLCHDNGEPRVVAISGSDGSVIWDVSPADTKSDPTIVVAVDAVVVIGRRGAINAYELRTGAPRWRADLPDDARDVCGDTIAGSFLVTLSDHTLRRVSLATGAVETIPKPAHFDCVPVAGSRRDISNDYDLSLNGGAARPKLKTIDTFGVYTHGPGLHIVAGEHAGGGRKVPRLGGLRADNTLAWEHDVAPGDPRDLETGPLSNVAVSDDAVAALYRSVNDDHTVDGDRHATHLVVFERASQLGLSHENVWLRRSCLYAYDAHTGAQRWRFGCRIDW